MILANDRSDTAGDRAEKASHRSHVRDIGQRPLHAPGPVARQEAELGGNGSKRRQLGDHCLLKAQGSPLYRRAAD